MPLTFPSSPTVGQTYNVGTRTWTWDGTIWSMQAATLGIASISTTEIADNAITSAKIAANTITPNDLDTNIQLGYRNVVINGAMQIAQRGTSTANMGTAGGYFTADRWNSVFAQALTTARFTQSIENDAPTGSGFRKSLRFLTTTASSAAAGDRVGITQTIEGQNLQHFLKGTASAKQFTLSFWVKSNLTGTYTLELGDIDNTRAVSASYTVISSGVWEQKTITFPADTTGAFDNDNAASLNLNFFVTAGTSFTSGALQTTWASIVNANRNAGQVNLFATLNNYWQITGVQLEAGSVATPFEFEDYGTTLRKCQRYCQIIAKCTSSSDAVFSVGAYTTTTRVNMVCHLPTAMRASPTLVATSAVNAYYSAGATTDFFDSLTLYSIASDGQDFISIFVYNDSQASGTVGYAGVIHLANDTGSVLVTSEL